MSKLKIKMKKSFLAGRKATGIIKSKLLLILLTVSIWSCKQATKTETEALLSFPEKAKDMTIYEVNIRQYTPEGTINAFIPHIKRLKAMGIQMLWLMPVQPIGEKARKGSLGSYYSIKDYTAVNPEFGTLEDFKRMVQTAHENEMSVILDWVANHTAFDHNWVNAHPAYYTKDSLGNVIPPVADWSDVADLNYKNDSMRADMTEAMRFWLVNTDIDGFRCDVADMVPLDFWKQAITTLRETKDIFMLAESETPEIHAAGFDMTYNWKIHHLLNDIAQGKQNADSLERAVEKINEIFSKEVFQMNFTTNHDENSWNGTVFTRLGEAYKVMSVLTFTLDGMPLLYSGQEAGLSKSLAFFEKDSIAWDQLPYEAFFTDLIGLKKKHPALWSANYGGNYQRISTTNNTHVFAFSRKKDKDEVVVVTNLSAEAQAFTIDTTYQQAYTDLLTNSSIAFSSEEFSLAPWSYHILQKK